MYQVFYTITFEKAFKKLDKTIQNRIFQKIQRLTHHPELLIQTVKYVPPELNDVRKTKNKNCI